MNRIIVLATLIAFPAIAAPTVLNHTIITDGGYVTIEPGSAVELRSTTGWIQSSSSVKLKSADADGASAVAVVSDTTTSWVNSGALIHSFRNNGSQVATVGYNGLITGSGFVSRNAAYHLDFGTPGNSFVAFDAGDNIWHFHFGTLTVESTMSAFEVEILLNSSVASGSDAVKLLNGARLNFSTADSNSYLYRSAADTIRTPGKIVADVSLTSGFINCNTAGSTGTCYALELGNSIQWLNAGVSTGIGFTADFTSMKVNGSLPLTPPSDEFINLGSSALRWSTLFATDWRGGGATQTAQLYLAMNAATASTTVAPLTIFPANALDANDLIMRIKDNSTNTLFTVDFEGDSFTAGDLTTGDDVLAGDDVIATGDVDANGGVLKRGGVEIAQPTMSGFFGTGSVAGVVQVNGMRFQSPATFTRFGQCIMTPGTGGGNMVIDVYNNTAAAVICTRTIACTAGAGVSTAACSGGTGTATTSDDVFLRIDASGCATAPATNLIVMYR